MKWQKFGQVFQSNETRGWRANSALTPTPILLNEDILRVYVGFRDLEGISRIGYVDLNAREPTEIQAISQQPVLMPGRDGCFDDNGVILGDVIQHNGSLRMYYVGFQLVKRAKFLAFTGLAESHDNGETFHRVSQSPIMDRIDGATTIRAIHSLIYENGIWRVWYASGDDWCLINDKAYPRYNIWYTESPDGLDFSKKGSLCIDVYGDEYRIGRPSIYKHKDLYYMIYTKGSLSGKDYFPGLAISSDGLNWERVDDNLGLSLSKTGFDSIHLCYPRLVNVGEKTYCVYNGNNMGIDGFGMAELLEW